MIQAELELCKHHNCKKLVTNRLMLCIEHSTVQCVRKGCNARVKIGKSKLKLCSKHKPRGRGEPINE